ncbi:unnamed protein product [Effrenium voratum]|uniref:Uncharacterized protein n=1 Tax=Effrenium voratum TaxID=2562239 RepID=A0AA36N562_9DINO|nr:unnamed protein product [Effrenium voratum]
MGIAVESQDVLVIGKVTLRVQREAIWRLSLRGGGIDCVLHPDLTRLVMQLAEDHASLMAMQLYHGDQKRRRSRFYSAWEKLESAMNLDPKDELGSEKPEEQPLEDETVAESYWQGYAVREPDLPVLVEATFQMKGASVSLADRLDLGGAGQANAALEGVDLRVLVLTDSKGRGQVTGLFAALKLSAAELLLEQRRLLAPKAAAETLLQATLLAPLKGPDVPKLGIRLEQLALLFRRRDLDQLLQLVHALKPKGSGEVAPDARSTLQDLPSSSISRLELSSSSSPLFRCWIGAPKVYLPTDPPGGPTAPQMRSWDLGTWKDYIRRVLKLSS